MNLKITNTCINCENLLQNFMCKKHNEEVGINNSCESHSYKESISKDSSCSNCSHYGINSCSKPLEASPSMLCFDWEIK